MSKLKGRRLDTINIAISILVAFAAWYYVAVEVSPSITKTIRNVPISCEGEYELGTNGLGVESANIDTVNVTVSLSRQELNKISADNITAVVDVSGANKGSNTLPIDIKTPSDVKLKSQSANNLIVYVTSSNNIDVDVTAGVLDSTESTWEPFATEMSAERVSVLGAKSQIEKVEYVVLPVSETAIPGGAESTMTVKPVAVDKNGKPVKHIVVLPSTISTTVYRASTKTVKVNVMVTDSSSGNNKIYEVPKTVVIKGRSSVLDGIESIDAQTVDISNIKKDANVKIKYNLPEGVQLACASMSSAVKVRFDK